MIKFALLLWFSFAIFSLGNAQTWTGNLNSNWNTPGNWAPATVPGPGSDVIINNAAAPNQPVLPSSLSIRDLSVSAGSLNLNGFELDVRDLNLTGGNIINGTLETSRNILEIRNMVFDGNITIIKNGGGNNDLNGGNIFNGPTAITNLNNSRLRLAVTHGDTFHATSNFNKNGTGSLEIAYNGTNTFHQEVTINNSTANNQLNFGLGGGTSTLTNGGLITTNFNTGTLIINNFTQLNAVPNGVFNPTTFTVSNSTFLGDFTITTNGQTTFTGSNSFGGNNLFTSNGNITMVAGGNTFSNPGNTTTITRNGGGNVTWGGGNNTGNFILIENATSNFIWQGGNTFNGDVSIINNSNNLLRLANTDGDEYMGTSLFINNGTSNLEIGRSGTNIYLDQITINNTNTGGSIRFGLNGGTNELLIGGLVTTAFSEGDLNIQNFTQIANFANGPFEPNSFTVGNSSFEGDFDVTTSGNMNLQAGVRFASNNNFISNGQLTIGGNSQFSTSGGNTSYFEKNGGGNVNWNGGNTFGTSVFVNNTNSRIRMTNDGNGDSFIGFSGFTNNGTDNFEIARNGENTFALTVTINNTGTGEISFGSNGGTSLLSIGSLQTTNFNSGSLVLRNFFQSTATPNGNFQPATFLSNNVSFQGNFAVSTSDTGMNSLRFQNNSRFARNNTFTSAGGIEMIGGNRFSTVAGTTTTMAKNGNANNDWQGGNIFGNFNLTTNGTGRTRLANSIAGDEFRGNVTFNQNGGGLLEPARNNTSIFLGNISTAGSANEITFGAGNGFVEIIGNVFQELLGDAAYAPRINRLTMNTTGALEVQVPLTIGNLATLNNGIINNDEELITFIAGSVVSGGSNASHINGRIRKVGNTAFTYPFGNGGYYAPLSTSGFGGGGSGAFHFTGRYFHTNPDLIPYDREGKEASIGIVNECEYWEFDRTNGSANPSVTLSWSDDRTCPIMDYVEFIVVQWNGNEWIDLDQTGLAGDETSGTVRNQKPISDWTSGIFSLGQSFRILPIELLSFSAVPIDIRQIKVSWSTATEKENAFFTVMKSLNGLDWFPIGIVEGAGNSEITMHYEFIDENTVFGRQYYRLTQTDFDGTSETFKVVGVTLNDLREKFAVKVYPNPTQGKLNIFSENQNLDNAMISLYNAQGSLINNFPNQSGRMVELDLSGLTKGIYIIKIYNNLQIETKKIILN